jgi:hypothetical protein
MWKEGGWMFEVWMECSAQTGTYSVILRLHYTSQQRRALGGGFDVTAAVPQRKLIFYRCKFSAGPTVMNSKKIAKLTISGHVCIQQQ